MREKNRQTYTCWSHRENGLGGICEELPLSNHITVYTRTHVQFMICVLTENSYPVQHASIPNIDT